MFLLRSFKNCLLVIAGSLLVAPAWAAAPPADNPLYNSLAILLICIMVILLIAIGILASVLTGAADVSLMKWKKKKELGKKSVIGQVAAVFIGFMLLSPKIFAQDSSTNELPQVAASIGGLSTSVFYIMISIIFLELLIIMALLINLRFLIKSQKETVCAVEPGAVIAKKQDASWWSRFNKFRPIEQEKKLDLGHEYEGIRELNNPVKPWWINWFYVTMVFTAMVFAAIYLWRDN
jgi:cytochrome c oxidase cbb3-type subunit 3